MTFNFPLKTYMVDWQANNLLLELTFNLFSDVTTLTQDKLEKRSKLHTK